MIKSHLKYALIPVVAITILALYPQISLWVTQGGSWKGSYHVSNYDEVAYSAYVNALINGAPRKNDPFHGLWDSPESPQYETFYSVQFLPAYSMALPARFLGLSASTVFILLICLIAIFSSIALYWFLYEVTSDRQLSAVGTIIVLCLGTAAAFAGELRYLLTGHILTDFLPFLRRYQPGFAFPIFFVYCVFARRAFISEATKHVVLNAVAAGALFAALVYSYFYLWTAAGAFLACLAIIALLLDRSSWRRIMLACVVVGSLALTALIPYFYLLSQRSANLERLTLLTTSRTPQILSSSLLIGLAIAAIVVFLMRSGRIMANDSRLSLILALSITPVILFNQQVITGNSLQPVHYELFIANYLVLAAAVLTLSLFSSAGEASRPRAKWLAYIGLAAFLWGAYETAAPTARNAIAAEIRDESVPAIRYAAEGLPRNAAILATNFITADFIPTIAQVRPLWNPHTFSGGSIAAEEERRLFYLHVYYSGFNETDLRRALREKSFEVTAAIFGAERALPELGGGAPVTAAEIDTETAKFADFVRTLTSENAYDPVLSSVIVPAESDAPLANVDRWYDRDEGKDFGLLKVYRLKPKQAHLRE